MRILTILLLTYLSYSSIGQTLPNPKVDRRVELLSIVFRLAEIDEYNSDVNSNYTQRIHEHFNKFKSHPLIKYVKKIRHDNHIAYDAVMAMAVHLKQPPTLTPLVPFSSKVPDKRWGAKSATNFGVAPGVLQGC
jgi:hypothetical protein